MSEVLVRQKTESAQSKTSVRRQLVNFAVYQVDPAWRRLPLEERTTGKQEFGQVIQNFVNAKRCQILTYSTVGLRADADIVLWIIANELEAVQDLAGELSRTKLGQYMHRSHSFLSMTKRSSYLDRFNPEHVEDRTSIIPGKYKYLFVYPFVKKREWYTLPVAERQKMMDEHMRIGNKYPSVKLNTTYSFGLDDQEFVVAFETDVPADFLDLVQALRQSEGSMYTLRDTPILTCIAKDLGDMLDSLGG